MSPSALIIDAYSHVTPPKYLKRLQETVPDTYMRRIYRTPPLYDLEQRFRIMDEHEGLTQVLTLAYPAIEEIAAPEKAADLAKCANDQLAELLVRHPDKFVGAIACLPMNNMDAALDEVDRSIRDLNLKGVLVYSNVAGKPLDSLEFMPLYDKMCGYDLPIYIHPQRSADSPDYPTERGSKYHIYAIFGWPYETTVAMTRLVFGGVLEKYPTLKIITHHCGGMIPYYEQRIIQHYDKIESGLNAETSYRRGLTKEPIEYFRMFYNDTAIHGNVPSLMCAHAFWGAEHLLFGADMPLGDRELGRRSYSQTISAINQMGICAAEKESILRENAKKLLHLGA